MRIKSSIRNSRRISAAALLVFILLFASCKEAKQNTLSKETTEDNINDPGYYKEEYRPQFHFTPEEKWMNDPNGMFFNEGVYHLFYQYYPEDIVWGPMHWGHATSRDLIRWEHQPIALYPDQHGYIFSGSAVVDKGNTSGLGERGKDPLVAIYTYHDPEKEKAKTLDHQTQGIAYSNDNGKTWNKYENNPVLPNKGKMDFRDPKVSWHENSQKWIMTLAVGDHAEFYASPDLKKWEFLSEFGKELGAHGGVWECPDLMRMKVSGQDEYKWVLLISINPGGPNGGSATQYFVGEFDGKTFTTSQKEIKWLDHGADNYAGVTYSNVPGGKHLFIGWMSNWNYAQKIPTKKWRSAMTLPRELILNKDENDYFVSSEILSSFDELIQPDKKEDTVDLREIQSFAGQYDRAEVKWKQKLSNSVNVKFLNEQGEYLSIKMDAARGLIELDRSHSGKIDFSDAFADKIHEMPYLPKDAISDVRIVLDNTSIELFIDQGRYVMTELFFPNQAFSEMQLSSSDAVVITELNINSVSNTWNNE